MTVRTADKTLLAIEDAIQKDQGASFRGWLGKVIPHIGDAYDTKKGGNRGHMGASMIGKDCPRAIWYGFRWADESNFPGRMLRLFNRGHLEEARFIAMLLMIGVQVYQQDKDGNQFRIKAAGGHFGGSGDGVGIGIPDLPPDTAALLEFKTANEKSFSKTKKQGVKETKFEHYVQINVYLRKMGLAVALYMVVNKNSDELYAELVHLDANLADEYIQRGETLVFMDSPPKKINESPGWYQCKWCDHRPVCHLGETPLLNCRTCSHSRPNKEGQWECTNFNSDHFGVIDIARQKVGCKQYRRKF